MRIERIANRQLFFIVFIMRTTVVISLLPVLTSADALQDAWASALVTFIGTVALVLLITGLGIRFPNLTIIEISEKLLGKVGGAMISLIILWAFLHLASIEIRAYTEMIITGFLPETPMVFLIGAMVLAASLAAYNGLEVVGRVGDFIFPLFLIMLLLSLSFLFIEADFSNLMPVLARGAGPVLRGSINSTAVGAQLMVIGMLIPQLTSPRRAIVTSLWGVAGASLILVSTAILTVAVMGPDEGVRSVFPFFKAIRGVAVGEFLERMEILAIFAWGFGLFISLSVFIYCGAQGIAQLLRVSDYRYLIMPMGATWVALSVHWAPDVFLARSFLSPQVFGPYVFFLILFPYFSLWSAYLVKRLLGESFEKDEEKKNG